MSTPNNPLDSAPTSTFTHVLVAFKYAEDAFNMKTFDPITAGVGGSLAGEGTNIVVCNELTDNRFNIQEAMWDFNFIPNIGVSTTTSVGKIVVADRLIPYNFIDFLRDTVLAKFNTNEPLMSLSHATFVLKTFFTVTNTDSDNYEDVIQANPFYFNVDSVESIPHGNGVTPSFHIIHAIGASNTLGLLRSFSSIYQMNITHKDGNIHDTIPTGTGTSGIKTRGAENAANSDKRKTRQDLSKPMLTLKDMFEGLEADLNQQKFVNASQLQEWRREIRSDNQPDKIVIGTKQKKQPKPEELPIDYVIDLDPVYYEYNVDNRNMPFEQPEISQIEDGIRVFPVRPGTHITELIEKIMLLSTKVGDDAVSPICKLTYKTAITAQRLKTDRYVINIKIRRYELPCNSLEENTGPGVNPESTSLEFFLNDPRELDTDVLEFKSHINYVGGDNMFEQQNTDDVGAGIVYADREQATAERSTGVSFFQTMYSGIRPMVASYGIDGLESAQSAGEIFNLMDRYTYTQRTDYEMIIRGNPNLMSDVNRNPVEVISDIKGAGVFYYSLPEINPMYIKLTIFEKGFSSEVDDDIPTQFYFDDYYHLTRVINIFGKTGSNDGFHQKLLLKRTDTLI